MQTDVDSFFRGVAQAYTYYLAVGVAIQVLIASPFVYLFSQAVILLRDIAIHTEKFETGEDYKAVHVVADIMSLGSALAFFAAAFFLVVVVIRSF